MSDKTPSRAEHGHFPVLILGAMGVVFGDIGTSPLYAIKEAFHAFHLPTDASHVLGLLSLVFWLVLTIVSMKYIGFIMQADNKGEGGNLALLALARRITHKNPRLYSALGMIGIFGGALFFADAVITPAISVLSAVGGLNVVEPRLSPYIIPIALGILFVLFIMQSKGTGSVGFLFGPIMVVWFLSIAIMGVPHIIQNPEILRAVNPIYAVEFFLLHPALSFWTLGSAMLAITGAEALYADMGHFGRKAITWAWILTWPCLLMNYFGQGAMLLKAPQAISNPFFLMAPEWFATPLLILATLATIIASQAVISGAFSVTRQAIMLGYLPRLKILHTSETSRGQIYIPTVNWLLFFSIIILILTFKSPSALAAAYGLAISGDMIITTLLFSLVARLKWRWSVLRVSLFALVFLTIEVALLGANAGKIAHGAWLPIVMSAVLVLMFATWSKGQKLLNEQQRKHAVPPETFIATLQDDQYQRVKGTGFYLTRQRGMVPPSFMMQLRHIKVLYEQIVFVTVQIEEEPYTSLKNRCEFRALGKGFYRMIVHYGYKETPNLTQDIELARAEGFQFDMNSSTFFIGTENIIPTQGYGMHILRDWIFMMMKRNSGDAVSYLNLPHDHVIELKSQHIV